MVLTSTILVVVLGLVPVTEGQVMRVDRAAFAEKIGHYVERTNRRGVRRLHGIDGGGRAYEATIAQNGHVEAVIGDRMIEFTVVQAR